MTKYHLIGSFFGLCLVGWFGFALWVGRIEFRRSKIMSDETVLTRDADPVRFYFAIAVFAGFIVLYFLVFRWFLQRVVPRLEGAKGGEGADPSG